MKQIPTVGLAAVRKLAIAGINSLEALEAAEPHRLNLLLQKNPPHGEKILGHLSRFPKLRVTVKMMGKVGSACADNMVYSRLTVAGCQTRKASKTELEG